MGEYAFLAGVLIAVFAGIASQMGALDANTAGTATLLLVALGIAVGMLNITERETTPFLIAAVALVVSGTANFSVINIANIGALLDRVVDNVAVFVVPGAVIVALKAIWALASSK